MGIATEYLQRLARLYREAEKDNAEWDAAKAAKRQIIIDDIKRAALEPKS
jgi:hypothetical protein